MRSGVMGKILWNVLKCTIKKYNLYGHELNVYIHIFICKSFLDNYGETIIIWYLMSTTV